MIEILAKKFAGKKFVKEAFDGTKDSLYGPAGTFASKSGCFALVDDTDRLDRFIDVAFEELTKD